MTSSEVFRESWWSWVQDYSGRVMTDPSDRFAAFAGLTNYAEVKSKDECLAGLWRQDLIKDCLWYTEEPTPRIPDVPSWSWYSLSGRVKPWKLDIYHHRDIGIRYKATILDIEVS
jgi:hypothetical protein